MFNNLNLIALVTTERGSIYEIYEDKNGIRYFQKRGTKFVGQIVKVLSAKTGKPMMLKYLPITNGTIYDYSPSDFFTSSVITRISQKVPREVN